MKRVSVDILTGALGAGKTTLLRDLLARSSDGPKVAVVMNEIGEIGIDGRVVTGLEHVESVVELSNGCICCSIEDYRFDLAVQELVATVDPALIVIETTGLAYPEPTVEKVRQAGLGLDAVVTVVDCTTLTRAMKFSRAVRAQIEAADFLVLSKTDLAENPRVERVRKRLGRMNPRAHLVERAHDVGGADRSVVDLVFAAAPSRLRSRGETTRVDSGSPDPHSGEEAIEHFSYTSPAALDRVGFEKFLSRLPSSVFRAKGLVRLSGYEWSCVFNFTCGRFELDWVKLEGTEAPSQAVFIGKEIEASKASILAGLRACEARDEPS